MTDVRYDVEALRLERLARLQRAMRHPQDRQSNADTLIEEHMALVVELYAGEVGSRHGVKLGDQVVVTSDGCRRLCPFPFSARLLA